MADSTLKLVTLTPETSFGLGADDQPQQQVVVSTGVDPSVTHRDEEDPRMTGSPDLYDLQRMGTEGSVPMPAPLVHGGAELHVRSVFRNELPPVEVELNLDDLTFAAAPANTITTAAGSFAALVPYVGHPIEIAGPGPLANRTFRRDSGGKVVASRNVGIILAVESGGGTEQITVDSDLMPLEAEVAGNAVTLKVGRSTANGILSAQAISYYYEEAHRDQRMAAVTATTIIADDLGNKLTGPAGTFTDFLKWQAEFATVPVNVLGFASAANNTGHDSVAQIVSVTQDGTEMVLSGIDLDQELAGATVSVFLGGSFFGFRGLLGESLAVTIPGNGGVTTQTSYQVGEHVGPYTRTRGDGSLVPPPGGGNPWFASRNLQAFWVGGHQLAGGEFFDSADVTFATAVTLKQGGGAVHRNVATLGNFRATGSFSLKHDQRIAHALMEAQRDRTPQRLVWRFVDDLGNVTIIQVAEAKLSGGHPGGDGETTFSPNFTGKQASILGGRTATWTEIAAPE